MKAIQATRQRLTRSTLHRQVVRSNARVGTGRYRTGLAIATMAGTALAMSACGSSASSTSAATSGGAGSTSAAASAGNATPYVLGVMASESGPIASSIGAYGPTLQAWAQWTNAHGGIAGHPVKLIVMDDAGNPTTAVTDVKQMVQQDHVIALINASGSEEAYAQYLTAQGVAAVGGLDSDPIYTTTGDFFSQGTSPTADVKGELREAQKAGLTKAAVMYCSEVAACAAEVPAVTKLGGPLGIKVVYATGISSTAVSYTAPCLAAKSAGADLLYISAASEQQLAVATACAQQGLVAPLITGDINVTNAWLNTPSANGAISSLPSFPFTLDNTPATKAFHDALEQYAPSLVKSTSFGSVESSAWTSGQLFAAAAEAANMGNSPSAQAFKNGLYALKGNTLGGLSGPITYVHGSNPNEKLNCYFVIEVKNGQFVEPYGGNYTCNS